MKQLDEQELVRYSRTMALPQIGIEGQKKLCGATVCVVGAGALGSAVATQLAAAGTGHIIVADFDVVELSNLQRQLAYDQNSVGQFKVYALKKRIEQLNSAVKVTPVCSKLDKDTIKEFVQQADVVVEGSDRGQVKSMTVKACIESGRPCVVGGVNRFSGQVMTFIPESDVDYVELFGTEDRSGGCVPNGGAYSGAGIFGPVPSIVASFQAAEVLKIITGAGRLLGSRLLNIDTLTMDVRVFDIKA